MLQFAVAQNRVVARGKFEDSAEHRFRIGHPEESQVLVQRFGIEFGLDSRNLAAAP